MSDSLGRAANSPIEKAAEAMLSGNYPAAETLLRAILAREPNNAIAMRMLGEIAARFGAYRDAEKLHRRAIEFSPTFDYARLHLAVTLHDQQRNGEALAELERIHGELRDSPETIELEASLLLRIGEYDRAADFLSQIIALEPANIGPRLSLAYLFKTIGRREEAVAVCRAGLELSPAEGSLWWALADLKTYRFTASDVEEMIGALNDVEDTESRASLHFALGKALGDVSDAKGSWQHYRRGNEIKAEREPYHADKVRELIKRTESVFTREFMKSPARAGNPSSEPIFIVGLPRSGSTLVEQILASHSMIEGTAELADIDILARSLEPNPLWHANWHEYPQLLAQLSSGRLEEIGRLYLERTRIQRKSGKPYFIDKMPDNWMHVGFIKLILPNARIIDVRRNPLACGYSNYKQLYARGHAFSYDLSSFAEHYSLYLRAMDHIDQVMPQTVHRVIHERLVDNPEQEIRRLLSFLNLPFEPACLSSHATVRPVRTASAEQVRQPIGAQSSKEWQIFEEHLGEIKDKLGPGLADWDRNGERNDSHT